MMFLLPDLIYADDNSSQLAEGDRYVEVEDGKKEYMLPEDFTSKQAYEEYLKSNPEAEDLAKLPEPRISSSTKKVTPTLMWTIKNLPTTNAIQKTYKGTTYLYVLQNHKKGNNTLMSRCKISGKTATVIDTMTLEGFGHTQTLEPYSSGNKSYWLTTMGIKAEDKDKEGITKWSRQFGSIVYKPGTTLNYTKVPRIATLSGANKDGKTSGPIKRVELALSSNKKYVLLTVQNTSNDVMYSKYDLNELNKIFNEQDGKGVKHIDATTPRVRKAATTKSFRKTRAQAKWPQGSNQGVEFTDADSIYIAGGNLDSTYPASISKYSWSNYSMKEVVVNSSKFIKGQTEIEGLQLSGDYVYLGINKKPEDKKLSVREVYRIKKSVF